MNVPPRPYMLPGQKKLQAPKLSAVREDESIPSHSNERTPTLKTRLLGIGFWIFSGSWILVFGAWSPALRAEESKHGAPSVWERSIVTLEVARKKYDYYQPWSKRPSQLQKSGLVVGEREILTTADEMFDHRS